MHKQIILVALLCLISLSLAFTLQPCSKESCINGKCETTSKCVCDPGFKGSRCDQLDNALPTFDTERYSASLPEGAAVGYRVTTVSAKDSDAATKPNCQCAKVIYTLEPSDNPRGFFAVDPNTGAVTVAASGLPEGLHRIKIRASNPGPFATSGFVVTEVAIDVEAVKSRQRRAIPPAGNVTFKYAQTFPTNNVTHLRMGEKLAFQVDVLFPLGDTSMNMEIFSPDNETAAVIMICDVKIISVGSRLNLNVTEVMSKATYEGKNNGSWPYVRVALPFGTVTHSSGATVESDYTVSVAYEAVFLYNNIVSNNTEYWVSAGAEYNNESVIWIGQTSFLANTDKTDVATAKETPSINITGDSEIYPGTVSSFNLDFTVPYLYSNFTLDVFGPLNDTEILSVCGIYTTASSGEGFGCMPRSSWPYEFTLSKQKASATNYYQSTLSFTSTLFTNKAYYKPGATTDDHRVSFAFAVKPNESAAVGNPTYVGASVDIGGTTVLSAYKTLQVANASLAPAAQNSTTVDPIISLTRIGPGVLGRDQSTMFELALDTVPGIFDYEIQALMPSNNSLGRLKICSMNVTYAGRNIPCLSQRMTSIAARYQILYSNDSVPSDQYDYAVISLPKLYNTGSVTASQDPLANRVTVRMVATVNNHTLNVDGESAYVTMGVSYADKQWVGINQINFTNVVNISSLPNESLPIVSLSYVLGDSYFNLYETAVIEAVTELRRGVTYAPMDFEFIAPFMNDSAVMTVCQAEVIFVGKYIGCSDKSSLINNIRLTSKNNSTRYDKAVFSLGTTSNVGPSTSIDSSTINDRIVLRFHVKMLDHVAHASGNGSSYSLSFGFQFSTDQIWIGQLPAVLTKPEIPLPTLAADKTPYVTFDVTNLTAYPLDAQSAGLLIKFPSGSVSSYTLKLIAPSFGSVCAATFVFTGGNISCVNETSVEESVQRNLYNSSDKEFLALSSTYNLGYIHNAGEFTLVKDTNTDANTLKLRVSFRTAPDASAGATGDLVAQVFYSGSSTPVEAKVGVTIASGARPVTLTNETAPTFSMSIVPLIEGMPNSSQFAPGQGFRARLTVTTKPNSVQRLEIRFVSPVDTTSTNVVDLLDAGVVSAGKNLPCTIPWADASTATKRNGSLAYDTVAVNLGVVCNYPAGSSEADNQIAIDLFGRVWTSSPAMPDGDILLSTVAFISDQQINVNQINITVNQSATPPQFSLTGNSTAINASFEHTDDIYVKVGEYVEVKMLLQVPEFFSSLFKLDIRNADTNLSAWATINVVNITQSGGNMMGLANEPYILNRTSSLGTFQLDSAELLVYTVQNSGLSSLKNSRFPSNATNNFTVTYSIKLADHPNANNDSVFQMSLGLHLLDRIVVGLRDIKVMRDNTEWPNGTVSVNISSLPASIYSAGEIVTLYVNVSCSNWSSAELQNAVLFLHTPPYIKLVNMSNIQYASGGISAVERPDGGMKFAFNNTIFLAETVQFEINVAMKENFILPGNRETANATSVYEFVYKMFDRAGNLNSARWYRKAGSVFFQVRGAPAPPDGCNLDFGMNDTSKISSCQISSFMAPYAGFEAHNVRPALAGWKPHVRGGDYKNFRYVNVVFGYLKRISRIIVYADGASANKPTCLNLYKTMDGRAYTLHKTIDISGYYVGHVANFSVQPRLVGRGVRVGVCDTSVQDAEVIVRFDLFGCNYSAELDSNAFDPCSRQPYDNGHCGRSYLYLNDTSDTIYYCDHVPTSTEELTGISKCYRSTSAQNRKWTYLGPAVGSIVAYHADSNRLYGYAQGCYGNTTDDRSYLFSEDNGITWIPTNPESYKGTVAKASSSSTPLLYQKVVHWTVSAEFQSGVSGPNCTAYDAGNNWKICYDGIYHSTSKVVSWNSCCSL
ncbi:hypothetical protein BOX15_Mlig018624g3 [Macrostomum lignano]|uniref:EGF-like domain-containing protein n=1 Tax=Macrostomum lignano TaxID=282301 RepID=A0A267GA83_9PLAT|nr:hypothetical protein BOX15_Mlig018624g3 [Macrostomum lignano]